MALFSKRKTVVQQAASASVLLVPEVDASILRMNNIVLLTIDERWTSLFSDKNLPPVLSEMQSKMNELLRKEAALRQELQQMEPVKKKAMHQIMKMTKEAFEDGNVEARDSLQKSRDEIEKVNLRWSAVVEEIDAVMLALKEMNLRILKQTAVHVFETMQKGKALLPALCAEIAAQKSALASLEAERDSLAIQWTKLSEPFTKLYGTEYVRQLENQFSQEIAAFQSLLTNLGLQLLPENE